MGGWNSGRRSGRATVEDGLTLDLRELIRWGVLKPGQRASGTLTWSWVRTGEQSASIGYEADIREPYENARMRLFYTSTPAGGAKPEILDYWVALETTRPRFGGVRWWFRCPVTGRRAAKLHLPPGAKRFSSRTAYGLAYRSQREAPMDRSHSRMGKLLAKLGDQYRYFEDPPPPKPKWMRWRTYDHACGKLEKAASQHEAIFEIGTARILARLNRARRR